MGKHVKTGDEARDFKSTDKVTNDNSEALAKAKAEAAEKLAARAEALGLDSDATEHEVATAEFEAANAANIAHNEKMAELKEKSHKLWMLTNTINACFAARATTNMAYLTESEIRHVCGPVGTSVSMKFHYNEEKTKGHITLKEFDVETRVPAEGEFDFSFDYAKHAKEVVNEKKISNEKIIK